MHPEVLAYLEVERAVRKRRRWAHLGALLVGVGPGLVLETLTHLAVTPRVEPHLAAAFDLIAWGIPVLGAVALARAWLRRWSRHGGREQAARIAARHGVAPAAVSDALSAR